MNCLNMLGTFEPSQSNNRLSRCLAFLSPLELSNPVVSCRNLGHLPVASSVRFCKVPMDIVPPHIFSLLREIAAKESLNSGFTISIGEGVESGFHGVIHSVKLVDGIKILPLIVKSCSTDPLTRMLQKTHDKFVNEVTFYSEISETLRIYGSIPRIPKYYGSCLEENKEVIILEDLRAEGFKVIPLLEGLDSKHLKLVAKALATLHATSLKWKNRDPENFKKVVSVLKETLFCVRTDSVDRKINGLLFTQVCDWGLKCSASEDLNRCSRYITESIIPRLDELENWIEPWRGENTVILHGDAWCHNFLFKYDKTGDLSDVAVIDWQMVKVGSPALDLLECFLSSANVEAIISSTAFLEYYATQTDLQVAQLKEDFSKWGAPAFLLVLAILVNFGDKSSLSGKFKTAAEEGCYTNQLSESTQDRIKTVMRAAQELGIFKA